MADNYPEDLKLMDRKSTIFEVIGLPVEFVVYGLLQYVLIPNLWDFWFENPPFLKSLEYQSRHGVLSPKLLNF